MPENVILVDKRDNEVGCEEKMQAHKKGKLHRAFSVFVFNNKNELLLQKRAKNKYHCGGLWSNTCCSHPRLGEAILAAANRRLKEEMGIECELRKVGHIVYRAVFDNGLIENEYDHIFAGFSEKQPLVNAGEADGYRWKKIEQVIDDMRQQPEKFTPWLRIILEKYIKGEIKFD